MNRLKSLLVVIVIWLAVAQSLPIACSEDEHCPAGYYCEDTQLFCMECIRCEQLKREPPQPTKTCITSVIDCGPCFKGLIPDSRDNQCVSSDMQSKVQLLLPYEWAVINVALMLAILICAAAVYILRNFKTFKILASTRTSVHSPVESSMIPATAPPPPYNTATTCPPTNQSEELWPFIKPISLPQPNTTRESDGNQAARVFNNPAYVRILQPPSYESPVSDHHDSLPTIQERNSDIEQNNSGNSIVSEGEGTTVIELPVSQAPPAKCLQSGQDTNNNAGGDATDNRDDTPQSTFLAHSGTAFIINVIKNVNTVQQRNEITQ